TTANSSTISLTAQKELPEQFDEISQELASIKLNPTPRTEKSQSDVDARPEFFDVTLKSSVQPEKISQDAQTSELSKVQLRSTEQPVVEEDHLSADEVLAISSQINKTDTAVLESSSDIS